MAKFKPAEAYAGLKPGYSLFPFNFHRISDERVRAVTISGEYAEICTNELEALVDGRLPINSELYKNLRSKGFLFDSLTLSSVELAALKLRTKMAHVFNLTGLHILVLTLRCEHSCPYCQVSRKNLDANKAFDMSRDTADRALQVIFSSRSSNIKIEFQGGEPLLNFELLQYVVETARIKAEQNKKAVEFVIATNLAVVTPEILTFCHKHSIKISTSLDGPWALHNANRPRPGQDSYQRTIDGIHLARDYLGRDAVSALMTTSPMSLSMFRDVIDEYVGLEFGGIFLRPLSPYGFAVKTKWAQKYSMTQWLNAYDQAMDYIFELNIGGVRFSEFYTSLIAKRILKPHYTGYVDLQHPSGVGLSALVYNYDGRVFSSDEGRMLAEMGDNTFCIGDLETESYSDLLTSNSLIAQIDNSFGYSASKCDQCTYLPYCGSDPTYHYATQSDFMGNKNFSGFCERQMGVINSVFAMLNDPTKRNIIEGWIS